MTTCFTHQSNNNIIQEIYQTLTMRLVYFRVKQQGITSRAQDWGL